MSDMIEALSLYSYKNFTQINNNNNNNNNNNTKNTPFYTKYS